MASSQFTPGMGIGSTAQRATYLPLLVCGQESYLHSDEELIDTCESVCDDTYQVAHASSELPSANNHGVCQDLWQWWRYSMAPEFLTSRVSKRCSWHILFPMLGLSVWCLDIMSVILTIFFEAPNEVRWLSVHFHWAQWFGLDGILLLTLFAAARLPIGTLCSDAVFVVILGLYPVTYCILLNPANLSLQFYNMLAVFMMAHSGIHPCASICFCLLSLTLVPVMGFKLALAPIVSGFIACFLVAAAGGALAPHTIAAFKALRETEAASKVDLGNEALQTIADDASDISFQIDDPVFEADRIGLPQDLSDEVKSILEEEPHSPTGQRLQLATQKLVNEAKQDGKPLPRGLMTAMASVQRAQRANNIELQKERLADKPLEQDTFLEGQQDSITPSDMLEITPVPSLTASQASKLPPEKLSGQHARRMSMRSMGSTEDSKATSSLRYSRSSSDSASMGTVQRISSYSYWSNKSPFSTEGRLSKHAAKTGIEIVDSETQTDASGYLCKRCMRPPLMPEPRNSTGSIPSVRSAFRSLTRMSARGSRSASSGGTFSKHTGSNEQSINPAAQYDQADPIVSCYKITESLSVSLSLQWAMKHWNLPRISGSCCPWHTALVVAKTSLDNLVGDPCDPLWSSLTDWQCLECTSLNHRDVTRCDMCFGERPGTATTTSSDIASTYMCSTQQDASWPTGPALSSDNASQQTGSKELKPLPQSTGSWPAGPVRSNETSQVPPIGSPGTAVSSKSLGSKHSAVTAEATT